MTTFRRVSLAIYLSRLFFLALAVLSLSAEARAQNTIKVGYYDMFEGQGAAEQVAPITAAGFEPVKLFNVTAADLAGINVLFVQNPSNTTYGAEYLAGRPAIQSAVSSGLVLVIHDRAVGSATTPQILPAAGAPPLIATRTPFSTPIPPSTTNIQVSDPNTLVANGPGGMITDTNLDNGNPSNLGFVNLGMPVGRKGLLHTGTSGTSPRMQSVTFSYPVGLGFVIYSTIPLDGYLKGTGNNPPRDNLNTIYAPNLLAYAGCSLRPSQPAVSVSAVAGHYGGTTTVEAKLGCGMTPLAGLLVNFSLNGASVGSASTDASGRATLTNVSLGATLDSAIAAGIYADGVSATFAGAGLFTASSGTAALTVDKAPATIDVIGGTFVYDGAPHAATASVTGVFHEVLAPATFTYTDANGVTGETAPVSVGTYVITATSTETDNYLSTAVSSSLTTITITPAGLTVTANNQDRLYGGTNPTFDGTIVGILGQDNITATYATQATSSSPVGTYDIVPTLLDPDGRLANYGTPTVVNGVLTINSAPLTVTANNHDRLYGGTNPVFDGTMVGIQGQDNITASYAAQATPSSPVGTYDIVPTLLDPGGTLANYGVTVVNGVLTINPAPLTVTANNRSRLYGGANPTFDGTLVGILGQDNITASYATQATSSDPVGTYDIVPTLLDPDGRLANYATPAVVNGVFTIDPAPLTVTASNQDRLYGGTNPAFDGTIVGVLGQDTITASYATQATSSSPVGTYGIVPTLLDPGGRLANYGVTVVNGVLAINPAPLTVTANNGSRLYGGTNPTFNGTIVGVLGQDTITASYATQATSSSPVGTYGIVPTLLDPNGRLANYGVTVVNGVLTINPAPLTVTADDKERLFGTPNPVLTVSYAGLVGGDTPASLDVQPTVTTTARLRSGPGTYAIVVGGARDSNYTVQRVNGTLTISPPGRMQGEGFIDGAGARNHFEFDVRESIVRGERGSVTLRIENKGKDNKGKDSKRDNKAKDDRFVSRTITSVIFSDDPDFAPGRRRRPGVDTLSFTGSGVWNGVAATFEAIASDMGEPGRNRDTFSITIHVGGKIVASVQGQLDGGNVQSNRLPGGNR